MENFYVNRASSRVTWIVVWLGLFSSGTIWAGSKLWTSVGPDGGLVGALAMDPQNPSTVYAATRGGIFKSTDAGLSWSAATPGLPAAAFVSSLAIDPQNASTVYALSNLDVFKSTDAGANWTALRAGLPSRRGLYYGSDALAIDPQNTSTVYAATDVGVFKSVDGGASWNAMNSGLPAIKSISSWPSIRKIRARYT